MNPRSQPGILEKDFPVSESPNRPKVLWLNCRLLHPLIGGDRLRTFHMLRHLKEEFHITYVCPLTQSDAAEHVEAASLYCDRFIGFRHRFPKRGGAEFALGALWNSLFGSLPFMAKKYASPTLNSWLSAETENHPYALIVCDYLVSFAHVLKVSRLPGSPIVVFQHNVESLIWQRHAEATSHPLKRWIFRREELLTRRLEDACNRLAEGQVTVSPDETHHFRHLRGMSNILGDVPTGVDATYFQPSTSFDPHTIAFLGSMDWEANCEAVRRFLREAYPLIKKRVPDTRFLVIGRNPPSDLRDAATLDPSIEITGTVDDVRPYLARAAVMVLPLAIGGGTRVKVYEAMAAGLAIVSTPVGVEGLPMENGQHLLIASSMEEFATAVTQLLCVPGFRDRLAAEARLRVEQDFTWKAAAEKFARLCLPLLRSNGSDQPQTTNEEEA